MWQSGQHMHAVVVPCPSIDPICYQSPPTVDVDRLDTPNTHLSLTFCVPEVRNVECDLGDLPVVFQLPERAARSSQPTVTQVSQTVTQLCTAQQQPLVTCFPSVLKVTVFHSSVCTVIRLSLSPLSESCHVSQHHSRFVCCSSPDKTSVWMSHHPAGDVIV
jgi:hypothetical protein